LIIGSGFGLITFPDSLVSTLGLVLPAFVFGLLPNVIKNFFEEAAWRGYLTPKIASLRVNDFLGHIVVGFIWGAWHIPYYLFFLEHTILRDFTTLNLAVYIPLSIVVMISWATVYGEIRLLTDSIWPVVLMHAVEDAFLFSLFVDRHIQILPGTDWLISPMNGLISVIFFLAIGIGLYRSRNKKLTTWKTQYKEALPN
jgi:membrane protease YdiL (CAAX protease family)